MHPEWVGVRAALMSLVPLGCADVANLFPHDDTEAGITIFNTPTRDELWERKREGADYRRSLHLPDAL